MPCPLKYFKYITTFIFKTTAELAFFKELQEDAFFLKLQRTLL
jgi:hypothetical protein